MGLLARCRRQRFDQVVGGPPRGAPPPLIKDRKNTRNAKRRCTKPGIRPFFGQKRPFWGYPQKCPFLGFFEDFGKKSQKPMLLDFFLCVKKILHIGACSGQINPHRHPRFCYWVVLQPRERIANTYFTITHFHQCCRYRTTQ